MLCSFGYIRLRYIVLLLAMSIVFVLSDLLVTWQQLATSTWSSSSLSSSPFPHGDSTARSTTIQAIYNAVAKANNSANVHVLTHLVDQQSMSDAAALLSKSGSEVSNPANAIAHMTTVSSLAQFESKKDDDTPRMKTEQLKATEMETLEEENKTRILESQLLHSLYTLTQKTTEPRGIVLPLSDNLVSLGLALVMELRSLGVTLPVEVPHCGNLSPKLVATIEKKRNQLKQIYVYNVCEVAAKAKSLLDPSRPIFCKDLADCHDKFRTLDIKVLAVVYSRFEELMLVDANTLLLQDPMQLWETNKFQKTGTLFFNDRISPTNTSLGYRPASRPHITEIRHYLSTVDMSIFRQFPTIPRVKATMTSDIELPFEPSDILLNSHAWNGRSGHQMDASLLLWSKQRQARATVVLASFVALNEIARPPFYGDQELFFMACEVAETRYTFSDFEAGAIGSDFKDQGQDKSVICGQPAQFFPAERQDDKNASLLFLSLGAIMGYKPKTRPLYVSKPRTANVYHVSSNDWAMPKDCVSDVTGVAFSEAQIQRVLARQGFHDIAVEWERSALRSTNERDQTQADDLANSKLEVIMKLLSDGVLLAESSATSEVKPVADAPVALTPAPTSSKLLTREERSKRVDSMEAPEQGELEKQMETKLIHSLSTLSQQTSIQRGIVLPLYDTITTLGVSLVLHLRALNVDLPIEIPHCGDFDQNYGELLMKKREQLGEVYVYNACKRAVTAKSYLDPSKPLFCPDLESCHRRFRNFAIKVLGLVYSQFEEIMLMDADVLLFQSPMLLWDTTKYHTTGTLFFNDRIAEANFSMGLGHKPANRPNVMAIEDYLSKVDVDLFRNIPTLARPSAPAELIAADKSTVKLRFQPSEGLLKSHAWNGRSAHRVDSSILLWNKKRQPRATAILASFISLNDLPRPPSYGDKELYFVACELAETQYSFSDFATGSAGSDFRNYGANKSVICGSAAHYVPEISDHTLVQEASLLYMNTDYIMQYNPSKSPMYYTAARPSDFFPGAFEERKLLMMCPFDITGVRFSKPEEQHIYQRQHYFGIAKAWEDNPNAAIHKAGKLSEEQARHLAGQQHFDEVVGNRVAKQNQDERNASTDETQRKVMNETQGKSSADVAPSQPRKNKQTDRFGLTEQMMEQQLVYTLSQITQRTTAKRGIVIPLFEPITRLGFSLILELRAMGINLPIEVPYCADLKHASLELIRSKEELGDIRAYDICDLAANAKSIINASRPVFCHHIDDCLKKFRSFMIKPLAVSYSQFEQILLLDADTTFFINPTVLFESEKFKATGNLLMHDRISHDWYFMAQRIQGNPGLSVAQYYFSNFDVTPFRPLPTLQRPKATAVNMSPVKLKFEPSNFLLSSHSFNLRSGHQVDSSLVMWDKKRQPRATAILASFVAQNDIVLPPSYGDKELFFYANELAETQYSMSDHAIGAVGTKLEDGGPKNSTLCGDMAQVFPIHQDNVPDDDVPLFYLNSDRILHFKPDVTPVYYMKARPWMHYPGSFGDRPQECPFHITVGRFNESHINHLAERRKFWEQVKVWK